MENQLLKTLKEKVCSNERQGLKPRFPFQLFDFLEVKLLLLTSLTYWKIDDSQKISMIW